MVFTILVEILKSMMQYMHSTYKGKLRKNTIVYSHRAILYKQNK